MLSYTTLTLALAATVFGHARVDTPEPRAAGPTHVEQCGAPVASVLARDTAGPIESAVALADSSYNCNAYVCRGYTYEDNVGRLKTYAAGEEVVFHVDMIAGHRPGHANLSVIDPIANVQVGEPLKTWVRWPIENPGPDRDDVDFSVIIPEGLEETCAEGGSCALQWYWYAEANGQTYESCVDFVVSS